MFPQHFRYRNCIIKDIQCLYSIGERNISFKFTNIEIQQSESEVKITFLPRITVQVHEIGQGGLQILFNPKFLQKIKLDTCLVYYSSTQIAGVEIEEKAFGAEGGFRILGRFEYDDLNCGDSRSLQFKLSDGFISIFIRPKQIGEFFLEEIILKGNRLDISWEKNIDIVPVDMECLTEILIKFQDSLDSGIISTMQDNPKILSDEIIELQNSPEDKIKKLSEKELEIYFSQEPRIQFPTDIIRDPKIADKRIKEIPGIKEWIKRQIPYNIYNIIKEKKIFLDLHAFLIATKLLQEIKNNNSSLFKNKEFIYPIHQYLSQMIRESIDQEQLTNTLIQWLSSNKMYSISRNFAAFELGMIRARKAIKSLLSTINDPLADISIKKYSLMALGMIGEIDVIGDLILDYRKEKEESLKKIIAHVICFLYLEKGGRDNI